MENKIYTNDDYAILEIGEETFYYGYEAATCKKHGLNKCPENCNKAEWGFVHTKDNRKTVYSKTELRKTANLEINSDPHEYLLAGIALVLSKKKKKNHDRLPKPYYK